VCPCIPATVVAEFKDQPLLFQPSTRGNRRIVVLEIRKISVTYIPEVLSNFLQVEDEKHAACFKIAQLENEIDPGLNGMQLIERRLFFRGKGKVLNAFFVREGRDARRAPLPRHLQAR
jgi:hypothetical protein